MEQAFARVLPFPLPITILPIFHTLIYHTLLQQIHWDLRIEAPTVTPGSRLLAIGTNIDSAVREVRIAKILRLCYAQYVNWIDPSVPAISRERRSLCLISCLAVSRADTSQSGELQTVFLSLIYLCFSNLFNQTTTQHIPLLSRRIQTKKHR